MKILYLTKGDHVDYQNDCLLIGLKELFGDSIVDYNKQEHVYDTYDKQKAKSLYGRGMTVTRVLPDLDVDRNDLTSKIKNKFFDYVVYGSVWRCNDHIDKILEYYPKNKIIAVDGEDETNIHPTFELGIQYFKRELIHKHNRLNPISFAIPTRKVDFNSEKIKNYSFITPFDPKTYVYDTEKDYYQDYKEAYFAVTTKKAGWDCMRHYEIMANSCIPYFVHLEDCPQNTLTRFPKKLCQQVKNDLLNETPVNIYEKYAKSFQEHLIDNNTTLALAKYFLETVNKFEK